ncbi:MAG: lipoprotein-releasing ABC transporter permease subunit [Burkholderiaceae bacterium]
MRRLPARSRVGGESSVPFEWLIGWRYTRAGRAGRRNAFISFISAFSMGGIALGVAALIIVLSVMNGFQKEVRDRMLAAIAHIQLTEQDGSAVADWRTLAAQAARIEPGVRGAAPYVETQSLLAHGDGMQGAIVRGIDPAEEPKVTAVSAELAQEGVLAKLVPGSWNIVLGSELARALGVGVGDQVTVIAPGAQVTPAGALPRLKSFNVVGIFSVGHYEYDSGLALANVDDAARLYRTGGPTGVQLRLADVNDARNAAARLAHGLDPGIRVTDWTRTNAAWYDAVQIEKTMMFIILTLIVAVAAFNLVTTLVMTVTDKQADIAILRTLGASPRSIMAIFMVQGASAGIAGTVGGVVFGLLVAFNIPSIVPFIEHLLHTTFLPASVYLIDHMPSDPQAGDIVPICFWSLLFAFVATVYPSWRAANVRPAEALRYE